MDLSKNFFRVFFSNIFYRRIFDYQCELDGLKGVAKYSLGVLDFIVPEFG